jgi:hypothetical protein
LQQRTAATTAASALSRFGKAILPEYYDNIEVHQPPRSKQKLTLDSAQTLRNYLGCASSGLLIPRIIHQSAIILWLIDNGGAVWFCLEEMYKDNSETKMLPRLNSVDYPKGYEKLGHPALIGGRRARIAGEITWSPGGRNSKPRWIISNKSGRYGIRPDIAASHLRAANDLFASYGLEFDVHYIPHVPK